MNHITSDMFGTTLELAKEYYQDEISQAIKSASKEPVECPCCEGKVRVYTRKLNTGMAITLMDIYHKGGLRFCHVVDVQHKQCTDYPQLRHWGLIEEDLSSFEGKRTSGNWRLTLLGLNFIIHGAVVPKYIHTINNELIGLSGEPVTIKQCLPDNFDYHEMMEAHGKL